MLDAHYWGCATQCFPMVKDRFHDVVKTALQTELAGLQRAAGGDRKMAVAQYRQHIKHLLSQRAERVRAQRHWPEYEVQTLFDTEQDHFQLLYVGWRGTKRDFGCILHLDIKDGKIWIQHDGTEVGIANELVDLGVPKQDIVLAFHEPEVR